MERPIDTIEIAAAFAAALADIWRELVIVGLTIITLLIFLAYGWYDWRSFASALMLLIAVVVLEVLYE